MFSMPDWRYMRFLSSMSMATRFKIGTGERCALQVNQFTWKVSSEVLPTLEPKLRPLTETELAELKLQRN